MPVMPGIEACAAIRARSPNCQVLILTVSEREPDLYDSLRVGAAGYLLKDAPPEELIAAAHSSCYSMALSNGLAQAGTPATTLDMSRSIASRIAIEASVIASAARAAA